MNATSDTVELLHVGYRYAQALCGSKADAEDLVHDAWLRTIKKHGPTPDRALLFRVIRNLHIDRFRHRQRFPSESFDEQTSVIERHVPEVAGGDYHDRVLNAGLAELRDVEREALFLSVIEGYTADQIAGLTESSRGTVLSLIHRTKLKLRRWLESREGQELRLIINKGRLEK